MRYRDNRFKRVLLLLLLPVLFGAYALPGCHRDEPPQSPNATTAAPARLPNQDFGKTDILKRGQGPK
ncbi:hypothetical protein CWRG_01905 [Chthonomonas calidirosea]|uniref:hypothetical protein n=1 Tax=Chthonomonas calidirosea TaxID=454171 RepID=UPI0006DD54F1|nr:hypothetical protein [Chthonomonas calidirosea]CEK17652.1 hypothetical protein CWRG_01905 [Chthonomonas calidirosea]